MPLNDRSKLNRIEELKSKLYSKNYQTEVHHRDNFEDYSSSSVPDSWKDGEGNVSLPDKFFMKTSLFKKIFIFSVGFFVIAVAYASYTFFFGGNTVSNNNIDIAIVGNSFAAGGEELPLQISITNHNTSALELVDLVLEYPKSSGTTQGDGMEHYRQSLGTIPAGAVRAENVKVILFGEQGSVRPVKVGIEYRVEGSNAIFVKEKDYEVNISSTPIDLSIDGPTQTSPDQDITLNVKATLNATKGAQKILLKMDYPVGFQFTKATPAPAFGNNVWSLGDLSPGAMRNIVISGKMVGVFDGEDKNFHALIGSQSPDDKSLVGVVFNAASSLISIKKSSVQANLFINGAASHDYAIDTKSSINGEIRWVNNLDTKIQDLEIRAKLSGNALDRKSVSSSFGFYNSAQDTIIWDKNSNTDFKEIEPGDSGSVNFTLSPLSLLSGSLNSIPDPTINVEITISGKESDNGYAAQSLTSSNSSVIRIISDIGFAAKALYYSGPFTNTGPIPPKAEKDTTYTITWSLTNSANNISKAIVHSSLPPWVEFNNKFSPATADFSYNPSSKEIIWNVGSIPKGAGINTNNKEISFQVKLSPSLSQVGDAPVLINDSTLTGHDDFANVDIRVNKASLNTRLANDPTFPTNGERVTQ